MRIEKLNRLHIDVIIKADASIKYVTCSSCYLSQRVLNGKLARLCNVTVYGTVS